MARPSRILVVDDTAQNRRLMEAVLSPLGHAVSSAEAADTISVSVADAATERS